MLFYIPDINECSSDPCQNGATCIDDVNGFACDCSDGFSRTTLCETSNVLLYLTYFIDGINTFKYTRDRVLVLNNCSRLRVRILWKFEKCSQVAIYRCI